MKDAKFLTLGAVVGSGEEHFTFTLKNLDTDYNASYLQVAFEENLVMINIYSVP